MLFLFCFAFAKRDFFFLLFLYVGFGDSLFISGKLLDLEKRVATSKPIIKSLSAENEMLKNKVAILTVKGKNDK